MLDLTICLCLLLTSIASALSPEEFRRFYETSEKKNHIVDKKSSMSGNKEIIYGYIAPTNGPSYAIPPPRSQRRHPPYNQGKKFSQYNRRNPPQQSYSDNRYYTRRVTPAYNEKGVEVASTSRLEHVQNLVHLRNLHSLELITNAKRKIPYGVIRAGKNFWEDYVDSKDDNSTRRSWAAKAIIADQDGQESIVIERGVRFTSQEQPNILEIDRRYNTVELGSIPMPELYRNKRGFEWEFSPIENSIDKKSLGSFLKPNKEDIVNTVSHEIENQLHIPETRSVLKRNPITFRTRVSTSLGVEDVPNIQIVSVPTEQDVNSESTESHIIVPLLPPPSREPIGDITSIISTTKQSDHQAVLPAPQDLLSQMLLGPTQSNFNTLITSHSTTTPSFISSSPFESATLTSQYFGTSTNYEPTEQNHGSTSYNYGTTSQNYGSTNRNQAPTNQNYGQRGSQYGQSLSGFIPSPGSAPSSNTFNPSQFNNNKFSSYGSVSTNDHVTGPQYGSGPYPMISDRISIKIRELVNALIADVSGWTMSALDNIFAVPREPVERDDSCQTPEGISGSCTTRDKCSARAGNVSNRGTCLSRSTVCCIVIQDGCRMSISQNNTIWKKDNITDRSVDCNIRIDKKHNVCQIRLNFIEFELEPPENGACTMDKMIVYGQNLNSGIPHICGLNTGQHIYIDVDTVSGQIDLNMKLGDSDFQRKWQIHIAQIPCNNKYRPPTNCLQYFTGPKNSINSFNFRTDEDTTYTNYLNYAICIRKERGYCSLEYRNNGNNNLTTFNIVNRMPSTGVSGNATVTPLEGEAGVGVQQCPDDYLLLGGIRVCGDVLNDGAMNPKFTENAPVRDRTNGPFIVEFRSDGSNVGKGFKLDYLQTLC